MSLLVVSIWFQRSLSSTWRLDSAPRSSWTRGRAAIEPWISFVGEPRRIGNAAREHARLRPTCRSEETTVVLPSSDRWRERPLRKEHTNLLLTLSVPKWALRVIARALPPSAPCGS